MYKVATALLELGALGTFHAPQPEPGRRPDGLPRWVVWTVAPGIERTARVIGANPRAARLEWADRVPDGGYYRLDFSRTWVPLRRLRPYRPPPRA